MMSYMEGTDSSELDIVIPCFNECESLPLLLESINQVIQNLEIRARVIIVDDASTDGTSEMISKLHFSRDFNTKVDYLRLSKNVGQMAALQAGFEYSKAAFIISMDADQQHPPDILRHNPHFADVCVKIGLHRSVECLGLSAKAVITQPHIFLCKCNDIRCL